MGVPVSMDTNDIESFDSKFTNDETKKLLKNFKNLDRDNDGFLSKDEFLHIEQLQQNPMVSRVLEIFDDDGNDMIDFTEFLDALYVFASTAQEQNQAKVRFAFEIYDVNGDGYISNGDLFRILKIMVGDNLTEIQLQQLVDRTILKADKDKDGKLSENEFKNFIADSDIQSKLVISLNTDD
mmetsp:Transcript_24410/g.29794  ORF Transcript_24410/g.29794 Transcript_24410/m.29794 type:complete len:181 (+) Transcript_24410:49-591(+)